MNFILPLLLLLQAAYLVGASHPSSVPASPQLIDQSKLISSSDIILLSCRQLSSTQSPWTLSHTISHHSTVLTNSSKRAAFLSSSPVTRCKYLQAARSLADSTAALLRGLEVFVYIYACRYTCTFTILHTISISHVYVYIVHIRCIFHMIQLICPYSMVHVCILIVPRSWYIHTLFTFLYTAGAQ